MASSSSPDLLISYQQLVASLGTEVTRLKTQRDGATRIAGQTLSILRAQPLLLRPAGIWIQEGDEQTLAEMETERVQLDSGKPWRWGQITQNPNPLPTFPLSDTTGYEFSSPFDSKTERPKIIPFRGSFPLEILEYIVSLCDRKSQAIFCRVSLACLEIFAPKLLRNVAPVNEYGSKPRLTSLFRMRTSKSSLRLARSLSLHHVRVLEVNATALERVPSSQISPSRLKHTRPILFLDQLIINMSFNAIDYPPPASSDDDDDEHREEDEPELHTFRPEVTLLSLLDPNKLLIRRGGISTDDDYWMGRRLHWSFRITREAARIISNWSRLRHVELVDVDLIVLDQGRYSDQDDIELETSHEEEKRFFLGLGGDKDGQLASSASREWNLVWRIEEIKPYDSFNVWIEEDIVEMLVTRDSKLQMERVKTARIVVNSEKRAGQVRGLLSSWRPEFRGPLEVVVAES